MFYKENKKTDIAKKWIFRVSGVTNFENLFARCQPLWCLSGLNVSTDLPKKTLDTSLSMSKRFTVQALLWSQEVMIQI